MSMTVQELILALAEYPDDMEVCTLWSDDPIAISDIRVEGGENRVPPRESDILVIV